MVPVLFTIGNVKVYSHGFFVLFGLLAGVAVLVLEARRRAWPKEEIVPIALAAFVGGMIGARVSMVFFHGLEAVPWAFSSFFLAPQDGLGSILGGVAGAYIGGYLASRALGKDSCSCDAFAPAMALAMAVGRIGDFLAAEDGLGKATDLPWGVPAPGVDYLVHPAPLYDMAFNLVWFVTLVALRDHPSLQNGRLLKLGLGGYAFFRFFVEFVRVNHVLAFGLTGQQFFSIAIAGLVLLYFLRESRQAKDKAHV